MGIEQSSVYKIIYKAIHNLQGKLLLEYAVVLSRIALTLQVNVTIFKNNYIMKG
jgi:hypothetical protein